jgi:acyl-CoA thioester hydrolase
MKPAPANPKRATLEGPPPTPPSPYLEERTTLRVRFNEVDALHIVWHGHYANYFEEGRRAFGRRYGVDYTVFIEHRVAVPVVQLHVDYFAPARLADTLEVKTRLLKSEAAKLLFEYEIRREGQAPLLASGMTAQVFTNAAGELLLTWPLFMRERLKAWEPLWKHPLPNPPSA